MAEKTTECCERAEETVVPASEVLFRCGCRGLPGDLLAQSSMFYHDVSLT
jgi:hypothetical protein